MTKDVTPISNFQFDNNDEDWSFGGKTEDTTTVANVREKVKAGTTIEEGDDDDDENEKPVNLDEDKGDDKEEDDDVELPKKKVAPKKVEQTKKEAPKKKEKEDNGEDKEDEEDEVEFFEDKKGTDKTKGKETRKEDPVVEEDDEEFFTTLASTMKEKGILEHVELPKDKKITEDEFFELYDEEAEARAGESLEAFVEDMDDDAKAFIKHKKRGGSTAAFLEAYSGSGIDYDKFDPTDEAQRDTLIRYYVTTQENLDSPEDIEERIQSIKDGGKAEAKSEQWAAKLKKIEDQNKKEFEDEQKEIINNKKEANKKFNEGLINTLNKVETVNDFPINKKLGAFFTRPTVKVGKDKYIPAFQSKLAEVLNAKNEESRKKLILLGTLLENDFDFSIFKPKAETTVTKRIKSGLARSKNGAVKANTAGGYAERTLASLFGDEDDSE